jgi:hypothetical protein
VGGCQENQETREIVGGFRKIVGIEFYVRIVKILKGCNYGKEVQGFSGFDETRAEFTR